MQLFDLKSLEILNFGIFKDKHFLDFEDREVIGIVAKYAEDSERSNRSGKSLVMEAILYLLEGNSRAKKEISLIHNSEDYQADVMYVKGIFKDQDGKEYTIKRGRDIKNTGLLEIDWIEKSTEAQREINRLFGIENDLELTNFFKQADIHGFMNLGPTAQKEYLMKWMDNSHWKVKEKMAVADRDRVKNEIKENDTVKKALESSLEITEDLEETKRDLEKKVKDSKVEIKEIELELSDLRKKQSEVALIGKTARADMINLKSQSADLLSTKDKFTKNCEAVLKYKKEIQLLKKKVISDSKLVFKSKSNEASELKLKIKEAKSFLIDLKNNKGICPILKSSCDSIKVSTKDVELKETEIEILNRNHQNILNEIELLEESISLEEKIDELKNDIKILEAKNEGVILDEIDEKLEEISIKMEQALKNVGVTSKEIDNQINELEEKLSDIKDKYDGFNTKLGSISHRIEESKKAITKISAIDKHNEELRIELEDLNYICMMFGKNGIPSDEIENGFVEVEQNINLVLDELGCGLTLNFNPDKELDKMEPICSCGFAFPKGFRGNDCPECHSVRMKQRKDDINLKITENGIEKDFSMDSGGGRTLISFAVRIALTILKRQQSKCKLNMLFLDEIDGPLDPYFAEQIISAITKLLTKKLGFSQILLVSHKEIVKNSLPCILQVTRKKDNTSTLAFLE